MPGIIIVRSQIQRSGARTASPRSVERSCFFVHSASARADVPMVRAQQQKEGCRTRFTTSHRHELVASIVQSGVPQAAA